MNIADLPLLQHDALALILKEHHKIKQLFKAFNKTTNASSCENLAHEVCFTLTVMADIEAEIFYPFLRAQNPGAFGSLVDKALVQHACTQQLIAQIQGMGAEDPLFYASVTVLSEYINHHIEAKEGELFPKLIVLNIDLRNIAKKMEMTHHKKALTIEAHLV